MPKHKTKPSTPRLSEAARHVVAPKGIVSTGWPAVESKCRDLGITFRWWQKPIGQIILSKRSDGKYASTIGGTGLSIPRQVGKTFLVGAIIFALCLLRPNLTVVWTAHRLKTAEETFKKMQAFAKRKRVAPHILKVVLGSGEEEIQFRNGSRILFGSRERGFGRGFDEVDVLIFDEAQILTENALDDMIPATNQSRQPTGALLLFMGTPPKPKDPSEVFLRMRREALSGEDDDTGWIEFGADKDYRPTPAPASLTEADWAQVAKANPSYPDDTPREAILRMRKKLGPESFLREGLGVYDDDETPTGPFSRGAWARCSTTEPPPPVAALGLALDVDRVWLSLGASSAGEVQHLGAVLRTRLDSGRIEMLDEAERIAMQYDVPVAGDAKGPAAPLLDDLEARGVRVMRGGLEDFIEACADLYDAVEASQVAHGDHHELNNAVASAGWRKVGDRRVWSRRMGDVTMLEGVTWAKWAAVEAPSVYETRGLVTL